MNKRVKEIEDLALRKWFFLSSGDSDKANKAFEKLVFLAKELRSENKLNLLEELLDNNSEEVRLEVASILLTINNLKAEKVLESLSNLSGMLAFTADITLKQWKMGKLSF